MNGAIAWSGSYTAFGRTNVEIETITNNLRFSGQYYDAETGLHYNWHRYYAPGIGRYLRTDPIGLIGGMHVFTYADDNPLNVIDSQGLFAISGSIALGFVAKCLLNPVCATALFITIKLTVDYIIGPCLQELYWTIRKEHRGPPGGQKTPSPRDLADPPLTRPAPPPPPIIEDTGDTTNPPKNFMEKCVEKCTGDWAGNPVAIQTCIVFTCFLSQWPS